MGGGRVHVLANQVGMDAVFTALRLGHPLKAEVGAPGASRREEDIGAATFTDCAAQQCPPKRGEPFGIRAVDDHPPQVDAHGLLLLVLGEGWVSAS